MKFKVANHKFFRILSMLLFGFASIIITSFALVILWHIIFTDFWIGLSILCGYLIIVLLVSVFIYFYFSIIALYYYVDKCGLKIVRLKKTISIKYQNIKSINLIARIPKRFFEYGVYFSGPYGYYRRTKSKKRFLFRTITHQKVHICCNDDVEYIITPENPEKFIEKIRSQIVENNNVSKGAGS